MSEPTLKDPDDREGSAYSFYRGVLELLLSARLPFLVGGAYALREYTGIVRDTKDLDLFILPEDVESALALLSSARYDIRRTHPHWLAKALSGDNQVDLIYNSGNGVCRVDAEWVVHGQDTVVLGLPVKLMPPEEMIWQKSFIMERHRYDGADVAHLLRARGTSLHWPRLLQRFGPRWQVLLAHLVLFSFIYPEERGAVPAAVMEDLLGRLRTELETPVFESEERRLCRGTLLSLFEYLPDLEDWDYRDGRLTPQGNMTSDEIDFWTSTMRHQ